MKLLMDVMKSRFGKDRRVLAPMVRAGTLPFRLQCLGYGADLVYTEEIIDFKITQTERVVDEEHGFVDFVLKRNDKRGDLVVLRTCDLEKKNVIFQIGTASPERAVQTMELIGNDVAGIDLNMGCPKHFSVQGGMGAALLRKPEVAEDILKALRRNNTNPDFSVTCKIRLLDTDKDTVELVKRLENAGAQAIGVHMRETHHRPRDPAIWDRLRCVVDAASVPIIANGDLYTSADVEKVQSMNDDCAVMFARGALQNPSVFLPGEDSGQLGFEQMLKDFVRVSKLVDNYLGNSLYTMHQMFRYNSKYANSLPYADAIKASQVKSYDELFEMLDMEMVHLKGTISWEQLQLSKPKKHAFDKNEKNEPDNNSKKPKLS